MMTAVEEAIRADPPDLTSALTIPRHSFVGMALQDLKLTAYVPEGQYRVVQPNAHRFVATFGICNCIAVFATCPGHTGFLAHINPASFESGLKELEYRTMTGGGRFVSIFKTMSDTLTNAFKNVKNSEITVSLVGGWKLTDKPDNLDIKKYYKKDKKVRTFSAVVLKCVKDALPGAKFDESYLNSFNGVSWRDATKYSRMLKMSQGESYIVAVLDTQTGEIHLQTSSIADWIDDGSDDGFDLPEDVQNDAYMHFVETSRRIRDQNRSIFNNRMPTPVLHEYVDRGVDERVEWPDLLDCG
jgi:hypothetical protein